ncbi:uncharacterized protein LOC144904257 [Branchiostoma floridae x Branchiostoma belcheri]
MDALQNRSIVAEELKVSTCLDSNSSASYLRSIHGLKKLSLTLPSYSRSVDKIANNFFPDMPNVVVFQLTSERAPLTLEPNAFRGLSGVQNATVTSTWGIVVKPRAFESLSALQNLAIITDDKQTIHLPEQPFEGLLSIETLKLQTGGCRQASVVSNVTLSDIAHTIRNVSLAGINVTGRAFAGCTSLRSVYWASGGARGCYTGTGTDISPLAFEGASSLESITLRSTGLQNIGGGMFEGLHNVVNLSIQFNPDDVRSYSPEIKYLPSDMFTGLSSVRRISLDGNPELPGDIFQGLATLREIRIENMVARATENSSGKFCYTDFQRLFTGLSSLEIVRLENSEVRCGTLPVSTFNSLPSLKEGSPSGCPSTDFIGHGITETDRTTCTLNNVNEVAVVVNNVSNNALRCRVASPPCPERCYCRTSTIVAEVFCTGRGLTAVPDRYPADTALARLDVNSIQYVPPFAFGNAPNLLILNLSTNAIREVNGSAFLGLRRLAVLYLDGNDLSHVPADLLKPLASLRVLWLSDNNLLDLPGTIFHQLQQPTFLRVLRLDHNNLTTLSAGIFTNRTSLTKLSLDNNKFDCDCHLLWLKAWMLQRRSVVDQIESVTCRSRGNAEDKYVLKPIIELPDDAFVCGDDENAPYNSLVAWVAAPGGLAILLILIAGAFKCRKNVRVWVYARGLRHLQQEPEKTYDFYVSYCVEDEEFVDREVVTVLEDMDPPYKVCLRNRDFIPGQNNIQQATDSITNSLFVNYVLLKCTVPGQNNIQQATDSITNSRRTLLVLTERFLQDRWCLWEFQVAHQHAVTDQAYRLIIIIMDDLQLEACDDIPDLKQYLTANRYLLWGELLFWDKLQQAVPPPGARGGEGGGEEGREHHDDDDVSDDEEHLDIFVPR